MPTKRSVARRLDAFESDSDPDGFSVVSIGGDPAEGGYYEWNDEREVYMNDAGHEIPPEEAPTSEFEYEVEFKNSNPDQGIDP